MKLTLMKMILMKKKKMMMINLWPKRVKLNSKMYPLKSLEA